MWIVWLEKKILKTIGILLGVLVVLLTAFHFWLVNNAESLLSDLVETRSNNKLKLSVRNLKFNYFSRKIELQNVVFYSNDSIDQKTSYHFNVDNIKLKVRAVLPIFLEKKLLIDSLYLEAPYVEVVQLQSVDPTTKKEFKDVSISEEMGKIYNSIMEALQLLEVTRFEFRNGRFTLINKTRSEQTPLTITNLNFYIENLRVDTSGQKNKFFFSDQMVFSTRNQDIVFPDGNHRLTFSNFRINIKNQLIEIDSCWVSGKKPDSSRSAFSVFFDTLKLVNFDFNALYRDELIKADTVYCLNPDFKIVLESKEKTGPRKQIPNLDTVIQQLTGDLQLNYVGVINATIDITTYRDGKPNSYTSEKNNFEMQGLTIDQSRPKPISLEGFTMAIRNYENFIKDSSYFVRFDSILMRNNKVLLSNFSINTQPGVDAKNIQVNLFELSGLSWSALLFDKNIKAQEVTLYYPVINYEQPAYAKRKKKQNIFQALGGISDLMELDRLRIVNGTINLKLGKNTELQMENASMVVNSQRLVESKEISSIEQSVEEVQFTKAILKIKDLFAEFNEAEFTGSSNQLSVRQIRLYNQKQTISGLAKNILLNELQFDESNNSIYADGVNWEQASVEINLPERKEENKSFADIQLLNIEGLNTSVELNGEKNTVSAYLDTIRALELIKKDNFEINGLEVKGKKFSSTGRDSEMQIANFSISDKQHSLLKSLHFHQYKNPDTIELDIPEMSIEPDINKFLKGSIMVQGTRILNPRLKIKSKTDEVKPLKEQQAFPDMQIGKMEILHPDITFENDGARGLKFFQWNGSGNSFLLENINTEKEGQRNISIGKWKGDISDFSVTNAKGKTYRSHEGKIAARLGDIRLTAGDSLEWAARIEELDIKNFTADSIGKKSGHLRVNDGKIQNLTLSSVLIKNLASVIDKNPSFSISGVSGSLVNEKNDIRWDNLSFINKNKSASLESFSLKPILSRDSFIAASPYQTDYITLRTGRLDISGIDVEHYINDTILNIESAKINNPYFSTYRDKRPPFKGGIIKPLPTGLIKKVPFLFTLDTVKISNGTVVYTELNEKTNETGSIPVTRITGDVLNIMNYNFNDKDSFRIRLNGYLMDSAWIRLRTRESYTDSLGVFLITVRMRPGSLTYLNSALVPLASVRIQSGWLDTISMRAVGKDYLAYGEMKMYYHDLKVRFLKNSDETKKSFLKGLVTFIANSFVIKNQNKNKSGVVYFPRLRDRSFINYYIKMSMSGVASSIGAKNNRKVLRQYRQELKKLQLPPIDYD